MMTDTLVGVSPPASEPAGSGELPQREPSAAELAAIEGRSVRPGNKAWP